MIHPLPVILFTCIPRLADGPCEAVRQVTLGYLAQSCHSRFLERTYYGLSARHGYYYIMSANSPASRPHAARCSRPARNHTKYMYHHPVPPPSLALIALHFITPSDFTFHWAYTFLFIAFVSTIHNLIAIHATEIRYTFQS